MFFFLRFCCLEILRNGRNDYYMTCRKGTAIIIGFLLLISLMSIKKSETGLRGNHHRKLGGHAMAYIDIENPEVCAILPCVLQSPRQPGSCTQYCNL